MKVVWRNTMIVSGGQSVILGSVKMKPKLHANILDTGE